jgi:DNA-binding CsgD family transcriptional regulator
MEQRIFFLKSEGLSYAEIGTRLGLSERRISRARNRLNVAPSEPTGEAS